MQQAHYFRDINYYVLKQINRRPEGGGHRSMYTPLNTPLGSRSDPESQAGRESDGHGGWCLELRQGGR